MAHKLAATDLLAQLLWTVDIFEIVWGFFLLFDEDLACVVVGGFQVICNKKGPFEEKRKLEQSRVLQRLVGSREKRAFLGLQHCS